MRIFTTRAFSRLDVVGELSDTDLILAVAEMNDGLWDANLGGQVYKKRGVGRAWQEWRCAHSGGFQKRR